MAPPSLCTIFSEPLDVEYSSMVFYSRVIVFSRVFDRTFVGSRDRHQTQNCRHGYYYTGGIL